MKTVLSIILCTTLVFTSCGTNQSNDKSVRETDQSSNKSLESDDLKKAKDCDEFIDQYEEWMDDYIILIDKYLKNPMDATLMEEYMKVAEESISWMSQWSTNLAYCASIEKYQKRFDEISEKAEKKLKEMGID